MLISDNRRISNVFFGDEKVSKLFMGEQRLFPICEKDMELRKDEYIDVSDVPKVQWDEPLDQLHRNMLRKGNGIKHQNDDEEPYSVQFTEEQQTIWDGLAEELFGEEESDSDSDS